MVAEAASEVQLEAMATSLGDLRPDDDVSSDALLGRFLDYTADKGLSLYPAQEEAILELLDEKNVILNTPTGSGKSLVASAMLFASLARGQRAVYTCPIKALVNEKWMGLCREFGPEQVGLSTGDATVNRDAPILCCTAEVLANIALREGANAAVDNVVMDEFHWYADRDRGVAWQTPLLTLPHTRFLLMSATLGDTAFFEQALTALNGRPTATVKSSDRPVPLEFAYAEIPLAHTLEKLADEGKTPVYVVHFTQADAAGSAQDFTSLKICTREEKAALAEIVADFEFTSPYGSEIRKWLKHGIGLHHAGLLPKYRVLVEQLAQRGLLKIICGTDTLGVGINVPIRTVLFTRLCKFDGRKTAHLSARDFHQIAGRAGRKGFDTRGFVVVQAPEHVIENIRLSEKAARDGKKVTKRRPPDHNFVNWDLGTFKRLIGASPEQLVSRFQVTHGMLLNVLSRPGDGCGAMRQLIRDCHEPEGAKKAHRTRAWQLFRSLVDRHIVEFVPETDEGSTLRVNVDLQDDFSMDQALSLYLLETIPLHRSGLARIRPRSADAGRVDPGEPGDHPAAAAGPDQGPRDRPDEGRRHGVRPADGGDGEAGVSEAAEGVRLHHVQRVRRPAPVGRRGEHPAEVDRARDVREVPVVRRVHARLRPRAVGRAAAAAPQQRLQGAEPDRSRRREDRAGARDGDLPPHAAAAGRLEPGRGVGADARPRVPAARRSRLARDGACGRRGGGGGARHHARRARSSRPPSGRASSRSCAGGPRATPARRWGRSAGSTMPPARRGRRSGCGRRSTSIAPGTSACGSTPRPGTCGTPT